MALIKGFRYKGIDLNGAYFRISSFSWRGETSSISLDIYASVEARSAGEEPITSISLGMPLNLNNLEDPKTQGYNLLRSLIYSEIKKMSEFGNAKNV